MVEAQIMRNLLAAAAFAALIGLAGTARAGSIQLLTGPQDPTAIQSTLNSIIQQINQNVVLTSGTPASMGGNNNTLPATNANGSTALGGSKPANSSLIVQTVTNAVNMLQILGAATSAPPEILATGTDPNISLALATTGTGVVQFASSAMWQPAPGLSVCPGSNGAQGLGMGGLSPVVTGYLIVGDSLGNPHRVPTC
jgi:hypothetical protein